MDRDEVLHRLIPYRMQAVDTLNYALRLRSKWGESPRMEIFVEGKQIIEGNLNAFTNPTIEFGLMHCRALLEFIGLQDWNGKLGRKQKRNKDDIGIECFSNANGALSIVDPERVFAKYEGSPQEAESAILTVFHLTNKGLAHITASFMERPEQHNLVEIASRGVPKLIVSYLYTPLGLPAPNYELTSRLRPT